MKKIVNTLAILLLTAGFVSCWNDDTPEAGAARHQVTDLAATPGDEEVELSWSMPEGWNPTDFIVFYTDAESQAVSIRTGGVTNYKADKLVNGVQYNFNVQAVYGKLISNPVTIAGKPATERFPVTDLAAQAGDQYVILAWSKPSTLVLSYSLTYYNEDTPEDVKRESIDKDATTITLDDLVNDKNYYFSLTADYAKGPSETAVVKAMPALAIPYTLDRELAAKNQPITFTFNEEAYPTATDVKWTFPGGTVLTGMTVKQGISATGTQTVTLSAMVNGNPRSWNIEVTIREYVIFSTDWQQDGSNYNGFKGACPVFSPDRKTVYNVTFNKVAGLYAFDLVTGNLKWYYKPAVNASSYNMLTVNPVTGDIYYGTQTAKQFYAVTQDGTLKWTFTEAPGTLQSAAPAVNAAGTEVYICDNAGNVFAIDAASGMKLWSFATGKQGGGLLVNGNDLVVGTVGSVHFLNIADGTEIAKVTASKGMTEITGFAVSNDKKTAYFGCKGGAISSIDLATRTLKVNCFQAAGNDLYEPVVAPNGTIFVGSKDSKVYNINAELTAVNWSHQHLISGAVQNNAYNYSHPCVDSENRFYITSGQAFNTSYIFDASGNVVDSWSYEDDTNQKQMGGNNYLDGVLYSAFIGGTAKNGIFVGKYVGGENASGWSTHGGDICGSCCIK
ncbi:PQQ-binding-like beta-propeller repeat protein [uncultured Alistipes sp.]|jgi:fibronectin type III domain./PQQ enzyme repeat|uniref:outer membrane protein assembly factor BamB family protein n=1 Tax=uncultured Alistipes sp. TaxID=538949 RepID=UPI0025D6F40A|nr:PQQ-binding-like beta-propeller repeat protein [uncultured Alistipes sp.]